MHKQATADRQECTGVLSMHSGQLGSGLGLGKLGLWLGGPVAGERERVTWTGTRGELTRGMSALVCTVSTMDSNAGEDLGRPDSG